MTLGDVRQCWLPRRAWQWFRGRCVNWLIGRIGRINDHSYLVAWPEQKLACIAAILDDRPNAILPACMHQRINERNPAAELLDAAVLEAHLNRYPVLGHLLRVGRLHA